MLKARPNPAQPLTAAFERTDLDPGALPRSGFVHGSIAVIGLGGWYKVSSPGDRRGQPEGHREVVASNGIA
jgi:hypothetical protein